MSCDYRTVSSMRGIPLAGWGAIAAAAALCMLAPAARARPIYGVASFALVVCAAFFYCELYAALLGWRKRPLPWAWFQHSYQTRWRELYQWELSQPEQAAVAVSVVNSGLMVVSAVVAGAYAALVDPQPCPMSLSHAEQGECAWTSPWILVGVVVGALAGGYCLYDTLMLLSDGGRSPNGPVCVYILHHFVYGAATLWYAPILTAEVAVALLSEVCNAPNYFCLHLRRRRLIKPNKYAYLCASAFLLATWLMLRVLTFDILCIVALRAGRWLGAACMASLSALNAIWFQKFARSTVHSLL